MKDVLSILLQLAENFQGSGEFFIWGGHSLSCLCTFIATGEYKSILSLKHESIVMCLYKYILLRRGKDFLHKKGIPSGNRRQQLALLEDAPANIADVLAELSAKAATLGSVLHLRTASNLGDLVRIMNTYYSNLIEGHHARPHGIERALSGELDQDRKRRDLQLEAKAHMRVQAAVDKLFADGRLPDPTSTELILFLHREFYRDAPEFMLQIKGAGREFWTEPGKWRSGVRRVSTQGLTTEASNRLRPEPRMHAQFAFDPC